MEQAMKFQIHIVDDEPTVAQSLRRILNSNERQIEISHSGKEAMEKAEHIPYDLYLLDYRLKEMDGISLLNQLKIKNPEAIYIFITAFGNVETAVRAMKAGAFDFVQKDQNPDVIRFTVQRALDTLRLRKEVHLLKNSFFQEKTQRQIVAESPTMKEILEIAEKYAQTDCTVLITGETGTGKNVLAEFIHFQSNRFNQPFLAINCCTIPPNLMESELFGYEKGAFTGAHTSGKIGLIERADQGTLFLDEIGELTPDLQAKLLYIIEKQEFLRIGSIEPQKVNTRIIAATNVNLEKMIEEKTFRSDLYYRLNVATIKLPPLRERKEDIIPLSKIFIDEFNRRFNKSIERISEDAAEFLINAPWKGNIRELKNLLERVMILIEGKTLTFKEIQRALTPYNNGISNNDQSFFSLNLNPEKGANLLQESQKQLILQALEKSNQNRSSAARLLGIPRTSLNFYIKKFGL
ncbi:MAG TPA: sigma-54-dependent Fis family transcriptional regulator [Caldithrix abyssi]|uniref:Sigma-54-dependent Fis family transcriptional regulator n=1 Tax=Caldithrix abyssi TaxID=187145 RepID=A0A7V5H2U3_CALAY|nr:sigma-54-dependent Fis family transcriptional regulator [Caldithrix abyssi]